MWHSIKKLFWISRPVSWPNTAYPFTAGYLMAGGSPDLTFWIGTVFFLIPYNLLMYGINDVFDYESDIKNPRKGGIEGMREQRSFHPTIIKGSLAVSIPFIIYLLFQGSVSAKLCFIGLIFFVLAYSLKYLRFKERPFLDSMTSSIHFVGPLIYALSLVGFVPSAWPYVTAFFLWGMASHAFGAVQDIIPDREAKLASIATVIGAAWTVRLCCVLYGIAAIIILVQEFPVSLIGVTGFLYIINILPFISVTDEQSGVTNPAWRRFIWLNYGTGFIVTLVLLYISFI